MKFRYSFLKETIIPEAACSQDFRCAVKLGGNEPGVMGIRTNRYDFAAKFAIAPENFSMGMHFPHAAFEPAGVQLDSFSLFQQELQNPVQNVPVIFIGISFLFSGGIPHYIIQMAVYIKIGKFQDVFQELHKAVCGKSGVLWSACQKNRDSKGPFRDRHGRSR